MTSPATPSGLPVGTVLDLPEGGFTVGEWAGAVWRAADRIHRQTRNAHGQSVPNPDFHRAHAAARSAFATVCAHLGLGPGQVGPCAVCGAFHHLYGPGGRPLCPACHARTHVGRPPGRPHLTILPGGPADTAPHHRTA